MDWEIAVRVFLALLILALTCYIRGALEAHREIRRVRPRSAWLTGLLDAEAGEAVEPQDWDDEVFPGYWREYAQGAFDYRRHMEERLP